MGEPLRVEVGQSILAHIAARKKRDANIDPFTVADRDGDRAVSLEEFLTFVEGSQGNFSTDQLGKLFNYLDDGRSGKLQRDEFMRCLTILYRVSRPNVDLCHTMGVTQGRLVRRLDLNEIVELVEGPVKESNKMERIRCRALKDGAVGWAMASGSNGVVFVQQTRVHFQVKTGTVL